MNTHDILAEYVEGLVNGNLSIQDLIQKYDIEEGSELELLLQLAEKLDEVLVQVEPSEVFVEALRDRLVNDPSLLERLRHLSAAQLAAGVGGLTVAAGLIWWARRSTLDVLIRRKPSETADALAS